MAWRSNYRPRTCPVKQRVKSLLLESRAGRALYGAVQERWFERDYRLRRERYARQCAGDPLAGNEAAAIARARRKIAQRGYTPVPRAAGEVHTFAFLPSSWPHQEQLARALPQLGPVTRFDPVARGFPLPSLRTPAPGSAERKAELLAQLLVEVRRAHRERPIDWFFSYALGWDLSAETLQVIQSELGFPTVNLSLDDKNWWDEIERGDAQSGLKTIAPHCDLGWTSSRVATSWYWAEGGQALFLPEGVDTSWFRPLPEIGQTTPVGFVGSNFGHRPELLETLRRANIPVETHGVGFPGGPLNDSDMLEFFNRCRINLGLGDMHYSRWLTNLKGRDFEVPATGRGLYVTTFNSDLAGCFSLGSEIASYRGTDELIELLRHYLRNPEESTVMAVRARERCVREHQWGHRFESVLKAIGVRTSS